MNNLSIFLTKFKESDLKNKQIKTIVGEVLNNIFGDSFSNKYFVMVTKKELIIKTQGVLRTELLLRKEFILKEINKKYKTNEQLKTLIINSK